MQQSHPATFTSAFSGNQVIAEKPFHHNNLILQLDYDSDFQFYHISIFRVNENQHYSLHGMFIYYTDALKKFNQIQL